VQNSSAGIAEDHFDSLRFERFNKNVRTRLCHVFFSFSSSSVSNSLS